MTRADELRQLAALIDLDTDGSVTRLLRNAAKTLDMLTDEFDRITEQKKNELRESRDSGSQGNGDGSGEGRLRPAGESPSLAR